MKKYYTIFGFLCLICAFSFLFTSCSSIYEHMPDTTEPEITIEPSDEYFTKGEIISGAAALLGVDYKGQWIYVEQAKFLYQKDNPDTPFDDTRYREMERLVKYNPVTKTVSSLCLDPNCMHSSEDCLFCAPHTWLVSYFEILGDWIMYTFSDYFGDRTEVDLSRTYLYNLQTGEMRQLHSNSKEGNLLRRTTTNYVMNGLIYSTILELDYSGEEEHKALNLPGDFVPETHQYIEVYDPVQNKTERLFEIPADEQLTGITNKRFIFVNKELEVWSTDYSGGNKKAEETIKFDLYMVTGKYAFPIQDCDYSKLGYNLKGYDLSTDSMFEVDFGGPIRNVSVDSGKLCYTTFSRIEEFREFTSDIDGYIKKNYPNVTDKAEKEALRMQIANEFQYSGKFQLYITDIKGGNQKLVFEGENMNFSPMRIVGNYIFGTLSYGDPNNNYLVTYPGFNGMASINIETGEIDLVPMLEIVKNN